MDDYVGTRELDITGRCARCGTGIEVTEWVWDLDDEGHRRLSSDRTALRHSDEDCRRFAALSQEQWPPSAVRGRSPRHV